MRRALLGAQPDDARETGGDADVTCELVGRRSTRVCARRCFGQTVRNGVFVERGLLKTTRDIICLPYKNALSSDFYDIIKSFYIP